MGQRVQELREGKGWSQAQLAERASLDTTYISGIERGQRNPGLNSLGDLAQALGVKLSALVSDLRETTRPVRHRGRPRKRKTS